MVDQEPLNLKNILNRLDTHIIGLIYLREMLCRVMEEEKR